MTREEYLLTCLAEECAEVAQACSKALRFGLNDRYGARTTTPREEIGIELSDLGVVLSLLEEQGILFPSPLEHREIKLTKLSQMMKYSEEKGCLEQGAPS